jgi:uncharacterized protein YkwD
MKKMISWIGRAILWLVLIALVASALILLFPKQAADVKGTSIVTDQLKDLETAENTIAVDHTSLDDQGVFDLTNEERKDNGDLPALTYNAELSEAAMNKAKDMFANQYFAHVSPVTGDGPGDIDNAVGYQYFIVGENLAEGDFTSDQDLLTAWMNSPEHRANILNTEYQQLGVAVLRGVYQGQTVWMAVQEFGTPTSDCTPTDATLKSEIDSDNATLLTDQAALSQQDSALQNYEPKGDTTYNAMVQNYNAAVSSYNALLTSSKALISQYNAEATAYNSCATAHGAVN